MPTDVHQRRPPGSRTAGEDPGDDHGVVAALRPGDSPAVKPAGGIGEGREAGDPFHGQPGERIFPGCRRPREPTRQVPLRLTEDAEHELAA